MMPFSAALLTLPHGVVALPTFMPDATVGVVRAVDADDLTRCGISAVVMNTFHLMQRPGSTTVQALGGLHEMSGWRGPIVTDSGGFQAYSLIHQNPRNGTLTDRGITFRPEGTERKVLLTPEKAVQLQLAYGADIVMCLDDCTHVDAPLVDQTASVQRTIQWARRCKDEFARQMEQRRLPAERRPLLFGVVQGGDVRDLRDRCATALLEMGFDGFGYGGWPLDGQGNLLIDVIGYTRSLIPDHIPMHALGVGAPVNVAACARLGYGLFDSAMPTRDARHGRLYIQKTDVTVARTLDDGWYSYLYINDEKHRRDRRPLSQFCDCPTCARYSIGYLHHLHSVGDTLYLRLATLHNLRFMVVLAAHLHRVLHAAAG